MNTNSQAPATRQDIGILMGQIGKLYDANQRWKEEIIEGFDRRMDQVMQHFNVVAENIGNH